VLDLVAVCSKIDGLVLVMVVACCLCWILYACAYIGECTACGMDQGEGVCILYSNPNTGTSMLSWVIGRVLG